MLNPESILENETHIILWDFDIQTDHLISARRPDLVIVKKKKKKKKPAKEMALLFQQTDDKVKLKESEKRDKYLDLARELKKTMACESDDANCKWRSQYSHESIVIGTGGLGN